jgi:hypothetical protein
MLDLRIPGQQLFVFRKKFRVLCSDECFQCLRVELIEIRKGTFVHRARSMPSSRIPRKSIRYQLTIYTAICGV